MLKDIVELVQNEGIKKTALIYVGESLKASVLPLGKASKLYNKEFTHEYRK